jgi:hypothetical protein
MIRSISAASAAQDTFLIEGPGPKAWIHNYINDGRTRADGSPRIAGEDSPMIYLVDQEPNSTIQMHFHQVDQYQIFVGGSGAMGRYPLAPITIHYTNGFTGYGPLKSGAEGLQYLTIRSRWDPGLRPLPEARQELPAAGSYKIRQRTTEPVPAMTADTLSALTAVSLRHVLQADKANAWRLALPPNAHHDDPADKMTDRVMIICAGTLDGPAANDPLACHYMPAGEQMDFKAAETGAELLILQFASRA